MNRKEFSVISDTLEEYYEKDKISKTDASMNIWYALIGDIDFDVCKKAISRLMETSKFFPSASEIRQEAFGGTRLIDIDDAWGMVIMAIRRYGYMREAEALDSLPEPCQSVVRNMGWQNICQSENIISERAFFRDSYNAKLERGRKQEVLPALDKTEKSNLLDENVIQQKKINVLSIAEEMELRLKDAVSAPDGLSEK